MLRPRALSPLLFILLVSSTIPYSVGGCCIAEGTLVATPRGAVPIEDLQVGDLVQSVDPATGELAPARITGIRSGYRPCIELSTGAGIRLVATREHPVYNPVVRAYRPAQSWSMSSPGRLATPLRSASTTPVLGCRPLTGLRRVFDLTVDSAHHNFIANGVLVHNKLPPIEDSRLSGVWSGFAISPAGVEALSVEFDESGLLTKVELGGVELATSAAGLGTYSGESWTFDLPSGDTMFMVADRLYAHAAIALPSIQGVIEKDAATIPTYQAVDIAPRLSTGESVKIENGSPSLPIRVAAHIDANLDWAYTDELLPAVTTTGSSPLSFAAHGHGWTGPSTTDEAPPATGSVLFLLSPDKTFVAGFNVLDIPVRTGPFPRDFVITAWE